MISFRNLLLRRIAYSYLLLNLLQAGSLCSALTASTSTAQGKNCSSNSLNSNRVFVAGLPSQCSKELLHESFCKFGAIQDISIIGMEDTNGGGTRRSKRKPYAFVTFDSYQSADHAIQYFQASPDGVGSEDSDGVSNKNSSISLFSEVKQANPIDTSKRKRSNYSRKKEEDERWKMIEIFKETNLILQVQSSHLHRLKEYIETTGCIDDGKDSPLTFKVEGSSDAVTKNMSLLFLSTPRPIELAKTLCRNEILARALKKAYVVKQGAIEANLADADGCERAVLDALGKIHDSGDKSFRIHSFPPSRQSQILKAMEKNEQAKTIQLNPKKFSDILSIVQVYTFKGRGQQNTRSHALVMTGSSPSFVINDDGPTSKDGSVENDSAVSRAYYKLKEAIDRYTKDYKSFDCGIFQGTVALDCGAAPGGWTKYLADELKCSNVYSVDPGELEIQQNGITHMQMKIQDAIPLLTAKDSKVKIYVSDMCLHTMETQMDYLLEAKAQGILEQNSFFVLTLKCKIGYSKDSFDQQVSNALDILSQKANVSDTAVYHLFSNRKGERTVMGFIS